jgi:hypothetical protein
MREELVRRYGIHPVFMSRYFERNAERRFAAQVLEFMLWRRGGFIPPHLKEKTQQRFLREEIENFYENGLVNLPQIQFAVTTRCTLHCRNCNAYIPHFGRAVPHIDLAPEDFARDLAALAGVVASVRRFMLLGGEPLLHPEFPEILAVAASVGGIGVVEIVTNGTVVPSPDVLRIAEEYKAKVYFHISNYSINPAVRPRLKHEAVFGALKKHGIKYQISPNPSWLREVPLAGRNGDDSQVKTMFSFCWLKRTLEVKNGRIAVCPKASSGYELGMVDGSSTGEVVDLRGNGDIRQKLIDFYHREFFEACRGCVRIDEEVMPAEQL